MKENHQNIIAWIILIPSNYMYSAFILANWLSTSGYYLSYYYLKRAENLERLPLEPPIPESYQHQKVKKIVAPRIS